MSEVDADALSLGQETRLAPGEARVLRAIYEASFPPSEREEFGGVLASAAAGSRALFVARLAGEPVGLAAVRMLSTPDKVGYLEYLATAAHLRSRGIGGRLLRHLIETLRGGQQASALAFEVESVEHGPPEEADIRQRRIAFYLRHGAAIVECAPRYRAPNLAGRGVVHFSIMWLPLDGQALPPSGERLRALVRAMLTQGYGLPADHPLLLAVLDDLVC